MKVVRPSGKVTWKEVLTLNEVNRVTIHHGFGCIIDEGEEGMPLDKIFKNIGRIEFTNDLDQGYPVVLLHAIKE